MQCVRPQEKRVITSYVMDPLAKKMTISFKDRGGLMFSKRSGEYPILFFEFFLSSFRPELPRRAGSKPYT